MKNIDNPSLLTEDDKKRIEMEERFRRELQETKFCFRCGKSIDSLASICPHCGVGQQSTTFRSGRSKYVAALLAFFLGWIGIHKFYLGRNGWGLLYFLFSWTFIPAIISFFEGIRYLIISDDEFEIEAYGGL